MGWRRPVGGPTDLQSLGQVVRQQLLCGSLEVHGCLQAPARRGGRDGAGQRDGTRHSPLGSTRVESRAEQGRAGPLSTIVTPRGPLPAPSLIQTVPFLKLHSTTIRTLWSGVMRRSPLASTRPQGLALSSLPLSFIIKIEKKLLHSKPVAVFWRKKLLSS